MKVMIQVKATKDSEAGVMPSEQLLHEMGAFNEALIKAGIMLAGEGLYPSSGGYRVHFKGKERTVINGPFPETKELVSGFWIWQVKSMEDAIEWVKRCPNPMLEESDIDIRQVFAPEDFAPIDPTGEFREHEKMLNAEFEKQRLEGLRFEKAPEFIVAGLNRNYSPETRHKIPQLWQKFMPYIGDVKGQVGNNAFGICHGEEDDNSFQYMAAVEVKDIAHLPSGFTHLRIPAQLYAVFNHNKHVSELANTFDAIYSKWLPNSGFQAGGSIAFEKYTEAFDPKSGKGGIEVWVPVKK